MGYFRLQANIISKKTQSAVACASYRSGEALYSIRDEETKKFKRREVAPVAFILKPDHAPDWALDREKLWNEVEKVEKAWNSQLAREILIALPLDLEEKQQHELVRSFVQEKFVNEGMVADVAIHRDKAQNPHAHIMLTIRPFEKDGSWGNKKTRQYEYDQNGEIKRTKAGKKVFKTVSSTDWNEQETLVKWRGQYAEAVNTAFKKHGIDKTVSSLSFEEQGLDKIAQVRLERKEYQYVKRMEEQGLEAKTFYHELNQEIKKTNEVISQLDEKITLLSSKRKAIDSQAIHHKHTSEITRQLDADYQKSLRFMENRLKGNVSFHMVHSQLQGFYRWEERILEPKQMEAKVTLAILKASQQAFEKKDQNKLVSQGFRQRDFHSLFKTRLTEFDTVEKTNEKNTQTHNMLTEHAERAYRTQSLIAHNTFNELYPEVDTYYHHNDRTVDFKAEVIEDMKSGNWNRVPLPEEVEYQLQAHELKKACDQAEKVCKSIRIQALTRNKLGVQKEQLVTSGINHEEVFQTSIKLNTAQLLIDRYQEKAEQVDKQLNEVIRHTFPSLKEDLIQQLAALPLETKTDLLNEYVHRLTPTTQPALSDCLKAAQLTEEKRTSSYEVYRDQEANEFYSRLSAAQQVQSHFPTGQMETELLVQLAEQAAHPHHYQPEPQWRTKMNRKGRNTRMRRYYGLEIDL